MIAKFGAIFLVQLAVALIEYFKPTPEEIERMKANDKTKKVISYINSNFPGFELPDSTKSDKWGVPKAKT